MEAREWRFSSSCLFMPQRIYQHIVDMTSNSSQAWAEGADLFRNRCIGEDQQETYEPFSAREGGMSVREGLQRELLVARGGIAAGADRAAIVAVRPTIWGDQRCQRQNSIAG
jgi:hypothetical protein